MGTDLTLPSIDDFKANLSQRLQAALGSFIPDEAWDKLIQQEWTKFTTDHYEDQGYGRDKKLVPSRLSVLIQAEIEAQFKKRIAEWVAGLSSTGTIDHRISKALSETSTVAAHAYMDSVGRSIVETTLHAINSLWVVCQCGAAVKRNTSCAKCGVWKS